MSDIVYELIRRSGEYQRLGKAYRGGENPCSVFGVAENAKAPFICALWQDVQQNIMILCANDFSAQKLYSALAASIGERAVLMPQRPVQMAKAQQQNKNVQSLRAQALSRLLLDEPCIVVASIDAARAKTLSKDDFARRIFELYPGQQILREELIEKLSRAGFLRYDQVDGPCQFAIRGDIVDICIDPATISYRLDFFGDELTDVFELDILSQRSVKKLDRAVIVPGCETPLLPKQRGDLLLQIDRILKTAQQGDAASRLGAIRARIEQGEDGAAAELADWIPHHQTAVDYLNDGDILMLDEPVRLSEHAEQTDEDIRRLAEELSAQNDPPLGWENQLESYAQIIRQDRCFTMLFSSMGRIPGIKPQATFTFSIRSVPPYHGRMDLLADDLKFRKKNGWKSLIIMQNEKRCDTLYQAMLERGVECVYTKELKRPVEPGELILTVGRLGAGFEMPEAKFYAICDAEILRSSQQPQRRRRAASPTQEIDLKEGYYVVHDIHGIGKYHGLTTIEVEGKPRDYMLIEYKGGDKLYIPAEQMGRVQKYIGSNESAPKINKMGGAEWERAKQKVRSGVKQLAQDLVSIYAQRQAQKGFVFSQDSVWQQEFEQAFPFEETEGQEQSIQEIKQDMESQKIMDRLLCGDVGYGKTEVAMRAAFKCVMDAKQVMVLAPTTILAQQHYQTFLTRFEGYPVRIEVLSRFRTPAEQKRIVEQFKEGEIDILIGTHRLLNRDVKPHDLGLLIVDEEQRFGVGHKETIKDIKRTVDVLTMTATPIPRTLEMALVGIRDMSIIHTPPQDRFPVNTYVAEYSDALMQEAVQRELSRQGQVYVVYNRVQTMERFVLRLKALIPQARIVMAHGQMPEQQLEDAMLAFYNGEYDVLVCSTIIESGLDIPSANTMVVYDADRLGLAQLYQLRGRVGRSPRSAYCYLTYPEDRVLTEVAQKRLEAISEFTELGSGFKIAMRDLEIRGAGNILGPEQHGHMSQVGYDTYCKLLADAVSEAKGEEVKPEIDTNVDIKIEAYLPDGYVRGMDRKLSCYREIAKIQSIEEREEIRASLKDQYGPLPAPVENLLRIALLRNLAQKHSFSFVSIRPGLARLKFAPSAQPDLAQLLAQIEQFGKGSSLQNGASPTVQLKDPNRDAIQMTDGVLAFLKALDEAGLPEG